MGQSGLNPLLRLLYAHPANQQQRFSILSVHAITVFTFQKEPSKYDVYKQKLNYISIGTADLNSTGFNDKLLK